MASGSFRDLRYYEQDIYRGPQNLLAFIDGKKVEMCETRYEDIVAAPEPALRRITDFLELPPLGSVELPQADPLKEAKLGDKTGIHKFTSVNARG